MQAEKPAVDGRDHQPPPCYGKAEKCGKLAACDSCRKMGGCFWIAQQGNKIPIRPILEQREKWESREAVGALAAPLPDEKTIRESDLLYLLHVLITTTAEEQEAVIEKAKAGDTAGDPEAEVVAEIIKGHEPVLLPLLDELTAKKYRCRLKRWSRNRGKKQSDATAFLTACDRVGVTLKPERRARLEKGRGSISAAEIYNVLDRENQAAAKERPEK